MKTKITSTIAGASAFITFFGFFGRILGLARESLFANYFGLSSDYDLYLIAAVFPISLNSIIIFIAQNYFIPNYHRIKVTSETEAREFSNSSLWIFGLAGLLVAAILILFSEPIIRLYMQGSNSESLDQTIFIFRIFILTLPLNSLFSILAALSQSELQFKFPVLSQLILNSAVILIVLFFNKTMQIFSIPLGYLAGTFIQVTFLYFKTRTYFKLDFAKFLKSNKFAVFGSSFLFLVVIEILGQTYTAIDRYFYSYIEEGGIYGALIYFGRHKGATAKYRPCYTLSNIQRQKNCGGDSQ